MMPRNHRSRSARLSNPPSKPTFVPGHDFSATFHSLVPRPSFKTPSLTLQCASPPSPPRLLLLHCLVRCEDCEGWVPRLRLLEVRKVNWTIPLPIVQIPSIANFGGVGPLAAKGSFLVLLVPLLSGQNHLIWESCHPPNNRAALVP